MFTSYKKLIINRDLLNKFELNNKKKLPELEKVTLIFECGNLSPARLATTILALEIISLKKGKIIAAKKPNVSLKVLKGQPTGCKVELRKKEIDRFLTKLNLEVLPNLKSFSEIVIKEQTSNFCFSLQRDSILLKEFEINYPMFVNLPKLKVNVQTDSKTSKKLFFLAKSIKIIP